MQAIIIVKFRKVIIHQINFLIRIHLTKFIIVGRHQTDDRRLMKFLQNDPCAIRTVFRVGAAEDLIDQE